jgi:hypothetical protein
MESTSTGFTNNGEILVMVDLFSRETMLEFFPDRKMERVCQTIMKRISARGVPNELRSDNAPELVQGIVRRVCQYLDIISADRDRWPQPERQRHMRKGQPDFRKHEQETFGFGLQGS